MLTSRKRSAAGRKTPISLTYVFHDFPLALTRISGKRQASEGLVFAGHALADRLALEIEAAVISATVEESSADSSASPDKIEESGLGNLEGQLRVRWTRGDDRRQRSSATLRPSLPCRRTEG